MIMNVLDPYETKALLAKRQAIGADHYDEVWDGVYMMNPMANNEHQYLAMKLAFIFEQALGQTGLAFVCAGVNLSDRETDWTANYRVPDVAVFLKTGGAKNCGTHWCGPADFLGEIVSEYDQTRAKLPFYSQIGVRELLIVDRDPWSVELYQHRAGELQLVGQSTAADSQLLTSEVVPFTFRLLPDLKRPLLEVIATQTGQTWRI